MQGCPSWVYLTGQQVGRRRYLLRNCRKCCLPLWPDLCVSRREPVPDAIGMYDVRVDGADGSRSSPSCGRRTFWRWMLLERAIPLPEKVGVYTCKNGHKWFLYRTMGHLLLGGRVEGVTVDARMAKDAVGGQDSSVLASTLHSQDSPEEPWEPPFGTPLRGPSHQ